MNGARAMERLPQKRRDSLLMRGPGARTRTKLPAWALQPLTEQQMDGLAYDLQLAQARYRAEKGHGMPPSELNLTLSEMLCRYRLGAAPSDIMLGQIQYGPYRGRKIATKDGRLQASIQLSARVNDPMGVEMMLAEGMDTKMGNASGDQAVVRSFADTNSYGGTTGIVPPTLWDRWLVKKARTNVWLPLCGQGIAPDLNWTGPIQNTTIDDVLFTSASGRRTLEAAIVPREEGQSGYQIRPTFSEANWTVRGYMWHSTLTLEMLRSRANQVLGLESKTRDFLGQAPAKVTDYDIIMALFWGLEIGMTRRWDATNDVWITTAEAPWGAAEFITTNAPKHQAYFDWKAGSFYRPVAGANYRKYQSSELVNDGVFKASGNKVFELLLFMAKMMSDKGKTLQAAWIPRDLLTLHVQDERAWNTLFSATPNPRLLGEPGYVGTVRLMGSADVVEVFAYDIGSLPVFATADDTPLNIDYLAVGCELGEAVTMFPWLPSMFMVAPEMEVVTVDGQLVTRPTMRDVLSLLHIECVEPLDLTAAVMVKCMGTPHVQQ